MTNQVQHPTEQTQQLTVTDQTHLTVTDQVQHPTEQIQQPTVTDQTHDQVCTVTDQVQHLAYQAHNQDCDWG